MSESRVKTMDDAKLLAYLEGDLDVETRRQVDAHLEACAETRARLRAFECDLDFLKSATSDGRMAFPDKAAIKRRAAKRLFRRRVSAFAAIAAAMLALATPAVIMRSHDSEPPIQTAAKEEVDVTYVQAALAQLEYETELVRALQRRSARLERPLAEAQTALARWEDAPLSHSVELDTASVLVSAARYWSRHDSVMAETRYRDLVAYYPDSVAAVEFLERRSDVLDNHSL